MPHPEISARQMSSAVIMARQLRLLLPILLLMSAATVLCIATNFGGFSRVLLADALWQHSVFAAVLVFCFVLLLGPNTEELTITTVASIVALLAQGAGILGGQALLMLLATGCLIAMLPRMMRGERYGFARIGFVICGSVTLPVASTLALVGQQLTVFHASTYDVPAYLADNAYGLSPAGVFGSMLWPSPIAHRLFQFIYGWLPAAVAACYVLNVRAGNPGADVLIKAALASGLTAFILYHVYPAAGPLYAFGAAFPEAMPDPSTLVPVRAPLVVSGAPRNCMPSVHLAWALLAAIEARRLGSVSRAIFVAFAGLTAFATLALGEHYLIDLVVAIPFTVGLHAACDHTRSAFGSRAVLAIFGAVLTLGWFVFLRLWTPPSHTSPLLWILTVTTIGLSTMICLRHFGGSSRAPLSASGARYASLGEPALPNEV